MSSYPSIRRLLVGTLELSLLMLLAFSLVRLFSERGTNSGQPSASGAPVLQVIPACPGDANLDRERDVRDQVLVQAHILGDRALSGDALRNADVNQDTSVNVHDIVGLLLHNLGQSELASCVISMPPGTPQIRIISPVSGPQGTNFTLLGRGFSTDPGENLVLFYRPEAMIQAQVSSASESVIQGVIPEDLTSRLYAVSVTVDEDQSNSVGYRVLSSAPRLDVLPSSATLLLPPGSGEDVYVIGGGTPPYKLTPLSEQDQEVAVAELDGNVIEVRGLKAGRVRLDLEDSAEPPATDTATVNVREPLFSPNFNITPHTLLAGSVPGFTISVNQFSNHMRLLHSEFRIEKVSTDFSSLEEGGILGIGKQVVSGTPDFQYLQVTSINSAENLSFDVLRSIDSRVGLGAQGTLAKGSAVMTLGQIPEPPEEGVVRGSFVSETILNDQVIGLPDAVGETFDVVATFTSTTVLEGRKVPLTKTVTRTFTTVAPASGAPRVERLLPFQGEIGHKVRISGSGFDPVGENNQVTFRGTNNTRVEAPVETASAEELLVYVPEGAITGPVSVAIDGKQSNDYQFWVLFQPDTGIFFSAGELDVEPIEGELQEDGLTLRTQQAQESLAPIIFLAQEPGEVGFDSLMVFVDDGSLDTSELEIDVSAGTASQVRNSGFQTMWQLFYGGQEETESGPGRHFFEVKEEVDRSPVTTLFVSEDPEGPGIIFDMKAESLSVLGSSLTISFEKKIYSLPETMDGPIKMTVEVRSEQWTFFKGSEMVVLVEREFAGP